MSKFSSGLIWIGIFILAVGGFLSGFTKANNSSLTQQISFGISLMWIGGIIALIGIMWTLAKIYNKK